jgi:GntR family transcriptional regulator
VNQLSSSELPIFRQIIDRINSGIENGEYSHGHVIPSEPELSREFNTTRMTVRRAIDALVNEGKLYRVQGRGTFVSQIEFDKTYKKLGFSSNMLSLGRKPSSKVLYAGECETVPVIRNHLDLKAGETLFCLTRIRMADMEPIALERVWLSLKRFPRLAEFDYSDQSLYDVLQHEFGLDLTNSYSKQRISAVTVTGDDAQTLFGKKRGVALRIRNVDYDKSYRPFAATDVIYHGARYSLDILI